MMHDIDETASGASFIPLAFTNGTWAVVIAMKHFSIDPVEGTLEGEIEVDQEACLFTRECESEAAAGELVGKIADVLEEFRLARDDLSGVTPEQVKALLTGRFSN